MDSEFSNTEKLSTDIYPNITEEIKDAANEKEMLLTGISPTSTYFASGMHPHLRGRAGIHDRTIDASKTDSTLSSIEVTSFTMAPSGTSSLVEQTKLNQPKPEHSLETNKLTNEDSLRLNKYLMGIVAFLICVLLESAVCFFNTSKSQPLLPQYLKEIENLKSNSHQQTEYFWNIIKSFPYDLLSQKNPNSPAVLLMVAPADGISLALQLTRQIVDILNRLLDSDSNYVPIINGSNLAVQDPDEQKMMIDEQIRNFVENQKQRAVVVVNLEKIDPMAIMIFHAYCDNSEAVYKDIAIILLLELPAGVSSENEKNIFFHLTQIWSSLGKSTINALFTRLANNIAILSTE